jgi:hypothetical protein
LGSDKGQSAVDFVRNLNKYFNIWKWNNKPKENSKANLIKCIILLSKFILHLNQNVTR